VKYALNRMTENRRVKLRLMLADGRAKMNDVMRQIEEIRKQPEEQQSSAELMSLNDVFEDVVSTNINPVWIKWGLARVSGLIVDGRELGVEDFLDFPSELYREIVNTVQRNAEMSGEEEKNSASPIISGGQVQSIRNSSTVEVVGEQVGSDSATA